MSNNIGFVYILDSPNSEFIKIGGSDYPPPKRVKEINSCEPYKSIGPWSIFDFRQVTDWKKTESFLHYVFRSKLVKHIKGQKELFNINSHEAAEKLNCINPNEIIKKPKIDRMFNDEDFSKFILLLFSLTGLEHWIDFQGIWTFVLFPSTCGGRYYTLNIGPHEVAFSTLPKNDNSQRHMILMDKLILDFKDVLTWLNKHSGEIIYDAYKTALPRSYSIFFDGNFNTAIEFLQLEGVRRALIAYWTEGLIRLRERNTNSSFARFHNWNAVAEINKQIKNNRLW